jgi:PAS domain S-box-containing protein
MKQSGAVPLWPFPLREGGAAAYAAALLIAGAAVLLRMLMASYLTSAPFITFFPAVVLASYLGGRRCGLLVALTCGLAGWFLFVTPLNSFRLERTGEAISLVVYFLTAIAIALLVGGSRESFRRAHEAQAALRESEARFRGVFDSRLMGFSIFDANMARTLAVNDAFLEMTGHTRTDFDEGRWNWRDFTVADYSALDEAAIAEARRGGRWASYEKEYIRKDGVRFPVRLSSAPLPGEPGRIVVGIEDITGERAARAALHQSEAQLRLGLSAARMVVWSYDLASGTITRSGNADDIFGPGSTPEAFIARILGEDAAADNVLLEAAIDGSAPRYENEFRYLHPDGRVLWLFNQGYVVRDAEGAALRMHGVCLDVTARKEAELALKHLNAELEERIRDARAERKLLADLVEGTDAVVQVIGPDFRWLALNAAAANEFERLYGVRPKVGDSLLELLADMPEHRDALRSVWARALEGEAFTQVGEFGDPARERRFHEMKFNALRNADGQQIAAYQFAYDVGERVREQSRLAELEASRREADALYRAYFESTPEALFIIGVEPDGEFVVEEVNPAHEAGIGLKLSDIRGRRVRDILPEVAAYRVLETYSHVLQTGEIYQYREVFDLDGAPQHWDTSLVPVRDQTGRIVRLIGSSRNITRQIVAEEALRQSQKMESMGQLTGGVAHDFNNLLTPILASLDLLHRKGLGGERERRMIDGALQSAERAKTLVQRLLAFARRQPLQSQAVDLTMLVDGMADLIASTCGPRVKVEVDVSPGLPSAIADANQVEMAILNLAVNARDAMPDGGRMAITLTAEVVGAAHRTGLTPGPYLRLSVADTGVGMDEVTLGRAVEPFFSTKGIGKGTGLGLSMAHGLAAQLGGALTIQSKLGLGTNVELWLPVSGEAAQAPERPVTRAGAEATGAVLLVDDESLVRMSTADMLADLGYAIIEAASAEEALRLIASGIDFDLLLTDHLMAGMTGAELAGEVRARRPGTPVLIVSGYAEVEGLPPDLPRLMKPFRRAELASSLGALSAAR